MWLLNRHLNFYFAAGRGEKYCDHSVCLSVCLSICLLIYLKSHMSKLHTKFSVGLTCYFWPWLSLPLPLTSDDTAIRYALPLFVYDVMFYIMAPDYFVLIVEFARWRHRRRSCRLRFPCYASIFITVQGLPRRKAPKYATPQHISYFVLLRSWHYYVRNHLTVNKVMFCLNLFVCLLKLSRDCVDVMSYLLSP